MLSNFERDWIGSSSGYLSERDYLMRLNRLGLAIHDELELIRKALTTPVVEKEKPSTGKAKG